MAETAFGIGAFCVAAAIIGGGLKASHIWEMPIVHSVRRQVLLGVFGFAMIGMGVVLGGGDVGGNGDPISESVAGSGANPAPSPTASGTARPRTPPAIVGTTSTGCEVTIANPLATFREAPANFAQEIGRVPAGTYAVSEIRNVPFGRTAERWLEITVKGRIGWVKDDTFTVESKSDACPWARSAIG